MFYFWTLQEFASLILAFVFIVHCLHDETLCGTVANGRYANCGNCSNFVACRARRRVVTCRAAPYFDRRSRKCIADQATACAGL